ncbi:MAG TPA: terminase family protein [Terriglobia bacterium]|nr:terminase family protein [Terriglobia bacterium]
MTNRQKRKLALAARLQQGPEKQGSGDRGQGTGKTLAPDPRPLTPGPAPDPRPPAPVEVSEPAPPHHKVVLRPYQLRWTEDPSRFAVAVKSAQIGYSTATAAWAVNRCLQMPRRTIIFLSRSERQSLELAEKAKTWLDGYQGAIGDYFPGLPFEGTSALQHEIRFPNSSRIIVLAANPDTARGYTGDVVLDEFAFHKDSQSIFTAVYRQVSLGYSMRVLSTPNGQQGKFWELAKGLGLDMGSRPAKQPVRIEPSGHRVIESLKGQSPNDSMAKSLNPEGGSPLATGHSPLNPWSGHWCDVFLAVEEGVPLNPQEVKGGCDEDTWLQEYCCQFVSQASEWIPAELFQSCVSSEASTDLGIRDSGFGIREGRILTSEPRTPNPEPRALYAGWDIARKHDLSVIWISELVGDVTWTRGVVEMRNLPTPDQIREAQMLMPMLRRCVIDKSGMGLVIFEALEREFPGQIEGVQFTQQSKEQMAVLAKRRMEEGKVRVPDSNNVRQSFRGVKKSVNAVGQVRFDAEHDARFGHADHWWAFCMGEMAAQQPAYHLAEVGKLIGRPMVAGAFAHPL